MRPCVCRIEKTDSQPVQQNVPAGVLTPWSAHVSPQWRQSTGASDKAPAQSSVEEDAVVTAGDRRGWAQV
ncbi:hypothetical protein TBR22_A36550 [Luteitalea sp. TBR-22]|nr:hypothetical protein TBR22_A36550 [Luteitalea sp. TBR-22]